MMLLNFLTVAFEDVRVNRHDVFPVELSNEVSLTSHLSQVNEPRVFVEGATVVSDCLPIGFYILLSRVLVSENKGLFSIHFET